ncbi:hypothetical protein DPMN_190346 [Dreissena polymorpha]|uniref:Uncharacterized protein n=1 Tax=Dreissena polymorpha TaxID=45954 RepID=A0A9D4ID88_DREPO|nr:hypothetical protein DPMN_190346 [Dreissena polymorpha]
MTRFELDRGFIGTNLRTKFHEDNTRNVASRVTTAPSTGGHVQEDLFTRKTATSTGGHVFQRTGTTFKLNQYIIKTSILTNFELDRGIIWTYLLTKFHKDRTRNVASSVFTNQMWMTDGRTYDGQRPIKKAHLSNQICNVVIFPAYEDKSKRLKENRNPELWRRHGVLTLMIKGRVLMASMDASAPKEKGWDIALTSTYREYRDI